MKIPSRLDRETFQQLLANAFVVQESHINSQSLSAIMEVQRLIARGELDLDGVMRHIVESAQKVANATGVAIALLNRDRLTCRAGIGSSAALVGQQLTASLTVSARAKTNREILRVENAQTDARIEADICRQFGANALLILPIYHDGALAGVLDVRFNEAHSFDDREVRTYRLMAEQIEAALTRAAQVEHELERNRNLAAEQPSIPDAPEQIAPLEEEFVPPPDFMMLPENEHSLYARCGAVLADIMQLAVFKQSAWLATTLARQTKKLISPSPRRTSTVVVARRLPTFKLPTLPAALRGQRARILTWPQRGRNSAQAAASELSSVFKRTTSSATVLAQRAKNATWPKRLRGVTQAAIQELSTLLRQSVSRAPALMQRTKNVRVPNRWRNVAQALAAEFSATLKGAGSSVTVLAQRAQKVALPSSWRNRAVTGVAIVLAFIGGVAYKSHGPAKIMESSTLPRASSTDQPALVPQPLPGKATAVKPEAVLPKQATPAKNALKRVRVGSNEVDYVGDDVTVRTFSNSSPAKRTRVASGRTANIGDDVTVRYFTSSSSVTKTAAR